LTTANINVNGQSRSITLADPPNECPICHSYIQPIQTLAYVPLAGGAVETVFRCPRRECDHHFVARYVAPVHGGLYAFAGFGKVTIAKKEFSPAIREVSEQFCLVYNEAYAAEQHDYKLICGPGYRKSLEFLIKDYAIVLEPEKAESIKARMIGNVISEFIQHPKIVAIAKRAAWLGNDETHYVRKWEEKDVQDLKELIDLTIHWIEIERATQDVELDMPDSTKKAAATS
jgi:hypothetical protein